MTRAEHLTKEERIAKARTDLEATLRRTGYYRIKGKLKGRKPMFQSVDDVRPRAPLSNKIVFTPSRDRMAHKWKKGAEEKPETVKAMEEKAARVAVPYNKGPTMFITDGSDPKTFGRK